MWVLSGPPAKRAMLAHIGPTTDNVVAHRPRRPDGGHQHDMAVTDDTVGSLGQPRSETLTGV